MAAEVPLIEDTSAKKPDLINHDDPEENISTLTASFTASLKITSQKCHDHEFVGRKMHLPNADSMHSNIINGVTHPSEVLLKSISCNIEIKTAKS